MGRLPHWTSAAKGAKRRYQWLLPSPLVVQSTCHSSSSSTAATTAAPSPSRLRPYTADLANGILAGSRTSLSRAITLVESHRLDDRRQAELLLDRVLSARQESRTAFPPGLPRVNTANNSGGRSGGGGEGGGGGGSSDSSRPGMPLEGGRGAAAAADGAGASRRESGSSARPSRGIISDIPRLGMRLGIAGPPGAGKSSFIEVLGRSLTAKGNRVAVISIDPSSVRTGGSILGDKTRMHELSRDPSAFVRGCPARGVLGGISRYTHDVVLLCQVAGYDPVIVESVGLGQSEAGRLAVAIPPRKVEVEHAVDMLVLMLPPAGGDDLQGSKKGIVEVADAIVVNKSDGELETAARATANDYAAALGFARRKFACWAPPVLRCSALKHEGISQVWEQVVKFRSLMEENGLLDSRRRQQASHWMQRHLRQQLMDRAVADAEVQTLAKRLEAPLAAGRLSPRAAAERLVDCLLGADRSDSAR